MIVASKKRKFDVWIYTEEGTGKEHPIQVRTVVDDGGTVSFEAEVKTPLRFFDSDQNANTLRKRVMARCAEGKNVAWDLYWLITVSQEGFVNDLFEPGSTRRYSGVGFLIEGIEVAALAGGVTVWRGAEGRSQRFGPKVQPDLPPTGQTPRGMCALVKDTQANRDTITRLYSLFQEVKVGMISVVSPANMGRLTKTIAGGIAVRWEGSEGNKYQPDNQEATCQSGPSSASKGPSALAAPAVPTVKASQATQHHPTSSG
jgi:hypothetical protein